METIFRWIHLSDIHVGHGDTSYGWDQKDVMDVLRKDIATITKTRPAPVDAILVTGDIAFSGAGRSKDEYDQAKAWLLDVAAAAGVSARQIFAVPGNHDVNRNVDKERSIKRLVEALRGGDDSIDSALSDAADRSLLARRMAGYLALSADLAPACLGPAAPPEERLYWVHRIDAKGGLKVRLAGLNTALLAADDKDQGRLYLGKEQIGKTLREPSIEDHELVIALSHHPFTDGWLGDQRDVEATVRGKAHLHLSGHVHEADADASRKGWGGVFVRVVAGSVHGDQGGPAGHGYSFGEILRDDQGKTAVRIFPRKWSPKQRAFVLDVENVLPEERYSEHELALKLPASPAVTASPVPISGGNAPEAPPTGGRAPGAPIVQPSSPGTTPTGVGPGAAIAAAAGPQPVPIFISSCPADQALAEELEKHLVIMRRQGAIKIASARTVGQVTDVRAAIADQMRSARIILLLLSTEYLSWEFCDDDLAIAHAQLEAGAAHIVPIILRSMDLAHPRAVEIGKEWFAKLERRPRKDDLRGDSVERWPSKDEAFKDIALALRKLVDSLRTPRS